MEAEGEGKRTFILDKNGDSPQNIDQMSEEQMEHLFGKHNMTYDKGHKKMEESVEDKGNKTFEYDVSSQEDNKSKIYVFSHYRQ